MILIFITLLLQLPMRNNKEQLDRLRIKSQLGQKIINYQQNKTTEKAQDQKQKFILKQQIMEDILRKKYNPQPEIKKQKPSPKGDSKAYSFGFPHPYSDKSHETHEVYNGNESSVSRTEEESSIPYVSAMRNKYAIPENKSIQSFENKSHPPEQEYNSEEEKQESQRKYPSWHEPQEQMNPEPHYIDQQISSNSYTFEENKSKYSNKYNIDERQPNPSQAKEYGGFNSFGKYSNVLLTQYEQESKVFENDNHSKLSDNKRFQKEEPLSVDQIAYNLSKQYTKQAGSKVFENIEKLPPRPEKRTIDPEEQESNIQIESSQKAYGGFIKEGLEDDEYLEQLRKEKIMKLEKKRLERSEERRKSQDLKDLKKAEGKLDNSMKQSYGNLKRKEVRGEDYPSESNLRLPPLLPEKKPANNSKSRTSSEAEHTRSSGFDKNSERQRKSSPHQGSSIQSSSSKGLLKTPKSSIFQLSPNRPKDKSLGKLFQDPKIQPKQRKQTFNKQSNKKMMMNAITNVCLPGQINKKQRQRHLEIIQTSQCQYFIFLFKQYSRNVIKAVYTYDSNSGSVTKVYGEKAPQEIHEEDVVKFYRFDSGAKEFKVLDGCKSFSYAVHAIYIK